MSKKHHEGLWFNKKAGKTIRPRQFTKEDKLMVNKHMKKCSMLTFIREIKIKNPLGTVTSPPDCINIRRLSHANASKEAGGAPHSYTVDIVRKP